MFFSCRNIWSLITNITTVQKKKSPNGVTYAKLHIIKTRLNLEFQLSQKWNLKPLSLISPDWHKFDA